MMKLHDLRVASKVLRGVHSSEKSYQITEMSWYVFLVDRHATRGMIGKAVEACFKVNVVKVNTQNILGKVKTHSRTHRIGRRKGLRKAFVKLEEGQMIEFDKGVKDN